MMVPVFTRDERDSLLMLQGMERDSLLMLQGTERDSPFNVARDGEGFPF